MADDFSTLIEEGVELAKEFTTGLHADVWHYPVTGRNQYGPIFGPKVVRQALVEKRSELVADTQGRQAVSTTKITFFESVAVGEGDVFAIPPFPVAPAEPNKTGWVKVDGLMKPGAVGTVYMTEVWLGRRL